MTAARDARGGTSFGLLVGLLVLGAGTAGVLWVAQRERARPLDAARIVTVERRELLDAVNSSGRVEPRARVAVMSRASGILEVIHVDEGDEVHVGQVLAELDREQLSAQLEQDRADQASAEARLLAAHARVAEAEVLLDDPELRFVRRESERLTQLFATGDVTERERDEAQRELARVEFQLAKVAASLPVLQASVAEAEADRQAAAAAVERGETALREATILCPIDGIVLVRDKEVGDGVSSILTAGGNATEILSLGDLGEMYIEARVDEVDLGRIHVGMPARVTVDAHRGHVIAGQVARIAPAGSVDDNGIVTFEVRVTVQDDEGLLRPDMTAEARLVVGLASDVPTLPHGALQAGPDGRWSVQRVVGEGDTEHVETVAVEIGLSDGLLTEIRSGLQAGDRVLLPDPLAPRRP